jgi:hypothetical protein
MEEASGLIRATEEATTDSSMEKGLEVDCGGYVKAWLSRHTGVQCDEAGRQPPSGACGLHLSREPSSEEQHRLRFSKRSTHCSAL